MLKLSLVVVSVLVLTGCDAPCIAHPDQKIRREIFKECMAALPAGPVATKYNDWDEVVAECDTVAYYQSKRGCGL